MTAEATFLAEGADYFGNRLIYRNKDVGVMSASGLVLTPEGEEIFTKLKNITDVEAKPRAARTKKPAKVEETVEVEEPAEASLDELLGG